MNEVSQHDPEIAKLLAKRRKVLNRDGFIDDYDDTTDDGDKYREMTVQAGGGTTATIEMNLSKMYQAGPSTTGDMEVLKIEAELVAEGKDLKNPHVPADADLLERATNALSNEGLTPAWEVGL